MNDPMLIVSMATRQDDQVGARQAEERGQDWYSYLQLVISRVGLEGVRSMQLSLVARPSTLNPGG